MYRKIIPCWFVSEPSFYVQKEKIEALFIRFHFERVEGASRRLAVHIKP
jgi:hypothetical protein